MNFIDLAAQQRRITDQLNARMARVLDHGQYINGPEVRELEQILAGYVGAEARRRLRLGNGRTPHGAHGPRHRPG